MRSFYSNLKANAPVLFWTALMALTFCESVLLFYSSWHTQDASPWPHGGARHLLPAVRSRVR